MVRISEILKVSTEKGALTQYIIKQLEKTKGVTYEITEKGDIFVTKGKADTYPVFICHTAAFYTYNANVKVVRLPKNVWVGYIERASDGGVEVARFGDIKASIYILLKLIQTLKEVKCVFYSRKFDKTRDISFFENARWVVEPSKAGGLEFSSKMMAKVLAGPKFVETVTNLSKKYGFKEANSTYSMGEELRDQGMRASTLYVSNGVWGNYGNNEQLSEADLVATLELCKSMARNITETCTYGYKTTTTPPAQVDLPFTPPGKPYTQPGLTSKCNGDNCTRILINNEQYYCSLCITSLRSMKRYCPMCGKGLQHEIEFFYKKCNSCVMMGSRCLTSGVH